MLTFQELIEDWKKQ